MPREIISTTPHTLTFAEYSEEPLKPGYLRVKVEYAAPKHGTEMHGWRSDPNTVPVDYDLETKCFIERAPQPSAEAAPSVFRPGNMWVGHVTEVGENVTEFKVGERIAGYGTLRETHQTKDMACL